MAVKLGFDNVKTYEYDEDGEPIVPSREKFGSDDPTQEEPPKPVYIPPYMEEELLKDFGTYYVRNFGDDYHLTEEERMQNNKFYKAFKSIMNQKHTYRNLPKYIRAVREVLKCLDSIAENNGVYDPEKFKDMYYSGKIKINGLSIPKYRGKESKIIDPEYFAEFVFSDEDPEKIISVRADPIVPEDELEEMATTLFDKGELERIAEESKEDIDMSKIMCYSLDDDKDELDSTVVVPLSKNDTKILIKERPEILYSLKEIKKEQRTLGNLSRYAYDLHHDDIEQISRYDKIHGYKSIADPPEFKGDLMDKKSYKKYIERVSEYEETQVKHNYNGRMKTIAEIEEIELKAVLEENGWNVRNLYENKKREKQLEQARKDDKKREKKLREKLTKIQERRKKRTMRDSEDKPKKKDKSKKKGKLKEE